MESLLRKAREAREFLTPVLKNSKFLTEGVLTPEEFVRAGDNLTFKCPTWRWESGDARHSKPYLPEHKQYLCTRGVPCRARVSVMEAEYAKTTASAAEALEGDDESAGGGGGGGSEGADWTVLSDGDEKKKKTAQSEASAAPAGGASKPQEGEKDADGSDSDSDSDYLDMEAFEDETLLQDDAAALPAATGGPGNAARGNSGKSSQGGGGGGNIEKTRTYDLSITYDNYYKTPRVWLFGCVLCMLDFSDFCLCCTLDAVLVRCLALSPFNVELFVVIPCVPAYDQLRSARQSPGCRTDI